MLNAAVAALLPVVSACSSPADRLASQLADAIADGDMALSTALADSLYADSASCSLDNLATLSVAYISINNSAVAADSLDRSFHAMSRFISVYSMMTARDSAKTADIAREIAADNPAVNLPEADSLYSRALTQLETLRRVTSAAPLK